MSQNDSNPLSERVEELEQLVERLRSKITLLENQLEEEQHSKYSASTSTKPARQNRVPLSRNGHPTVNKYTPTPLPSPSPEQAPQVLQGGERTARCMPSTAMSGSTGLALFCSF